MSKLSDYSKFDKLSEDDDEDEHGKDISVNAPQTIHDQNQPQQPQQQEKLATTTKDSTTGRYLFSYDNQTIYEWEQTLDDVNMYIPIPPTHTRASDFIVTITPRQLSVGLKHHDRFFIDEPTWSLVDTTESSWYLDDSTDSRCLAIVLTKAHRGETWETALRGHGGAANAALQEEMKQQLLLERFQEEHPGMDFRGAQVNGAAPDPRTFMGGLGSG